MRYFLLLVLGILIAGCTASRYNKSTPKHEFRGVWIATVVNIDWPKNGNDKATQQKKDFIEILDFYQQLNCNAAIVQVRTAGDAFYPSKLAPWSKYLTGKEGEAPKDFEDPLKWMIHETHKRGMEFHAWLNPYRATFDLDTLSLATSHDFYTHPDWMVKYGKKYYYDPGLPAVQENFSKVVEEIVLNYPVDAIHFDDYFYPYKIEGAVFDDTLTYQTYGLPNQKIEDWRRSNVDSLVKKVHKTIKSTKPWVQFGISPFGVWKNKSTDLKGSDTQAGQTTYEDLYADPLLWSQKGWLDYLVPQVYWSMDYPRASHRKITTWWADTVKTTNLYIGNGPYKIRNNADKAWNRKRELPKQLSFSRSLPKIQGNVFFSAKSLLYQHDDVVKKLRKRLYTYPAFTPPLPQKVTRNIPQPGIRSQSLFKAQLELCISHYDSVPRFVGLFRLKNRNTKTPDQLLGKAYIPENQSGACLSIQADPKSLRKGLGVVIVDAYGNQSEFYAIPVKEYDFK